MAYIVCFGFLNAEYRIALVGFICSSRGRIRKLRLAYVVCFGFLNAEYRIALVGFICSSRGHQRTKEKDSAEPLSSMEPRLRGSLDSTSSPRGIRCGGAYLLPRAWGNLGSWYQVLSLLASSEFCTAICVRAGIARVSVGLMGLYRTFFIIGGGDRSYLRLRGVFAMFFRRICADRDWIVSFGWKRYVIICIVRGLDCMGYPFS